MDTYRIMEMWLEYFGRTRKKKNNTHDLNLHIHKFRHTFVKKEQEKESDT